jgi:DNA (cytosine-5)-methyltransferase 1
MAAYYNEIDPYAAAWLRNLIAKGLIAPGDVDERSIEDVSPTDLIGYTQCHFFAGIGVWSHALRSVGWPDDRPVWTGSCPCQPFSAAGKGDGFADERHLWPHFHWLIAQCRPARVFGEQVASGYANPWIDLVQTDLEALGYGVGAVPFPSAGVGAPHIRDRLYWVADAERERGRGGELGCQDAADAWIAGEVVRLADAIVQQRPRGEHRVGDELAPRGWIESAAAFAGLRGDLRPGPTNGFWRNADWLGCTDGRWRPVEPGTSPLAHGAPARVGRLRAYGNAINAEAAAAFIVAAEEARLWL